MAKKLKNVKNSRKRNRRRKGVNSVNMSATTPLPVRLLSHLRYDDFLSVTPGIGTGFTYYSFRANDLYDPDYTGVGHQPRGFDQISALYDHFVVSASKIKIDLIPTNLDSYIWGICVTTSSFTTFADATEANKTITTSLGTLGSQPKSLTMSFNTKKWFGYDDIFDADDLFGTAGNSPSDQALFTVFVQTASASASGAVKFHVQLEYDAFFLQPKLPTIS